MSSANPITYNGDVLLRVSNLRLRLGDLQVLDGVEFEVRDRIRVGTVTGQVGAILGPSGVGKTRLLRILAGLDRADSGEVQGHNNVPLPAGRVGVVFQNYPLSRHRTTRGNLEIAGIANGMSRKASKERATQLLDTFHLADKAQLYPAQLSGGQRQRVAIAQQVMQPKTLLLMDEPFSGLDPQALDDVEKLIVSVANLDELNTILIVTHDVRAALIVSDTMFMLGRNRGADGGLVPGARIQQTYDLVALGLAWQPNIEQLPTFTQLEHDIKARFKEL